MFLLVLACDRGSPVPTPLTGSDPTGSAPSTSPPPIVPGVALSNLSFRVHPTLPTLVYATWEQSGTAEVHVEYSFDDGVWLTSPVRTLGPGPHEEVLLGIPYDTQVVFHLVFEAEGVAQTSDDLEVTTAGAPATLPTSQVLTFDPDQADLVAAPFLWTSLGTSNGVTFACIVDHQGRIVWAKRLPSNRTSLHPRVARDGRSLYLDYNSYWQIFDQGAGATVDQLQIDDTVLHTFVTPGLHHPYTDLPGGSLAYGEAAGGYSNEYLTIVHVDGSAERLWDCEQWLSSVPSVGYCSSNTLNYDVGTDKYLFSFWSLETIVEIDGTTAEVDRWFGHLPGSYAFDPVDSVFWWQHGGYLTDAGTLLTSSDRTTNGLETVIREYEIDDANQTLREVWNFGLDEGVYGYQMGEAYRLAGGNTLHNYGELARLREATPEGEVVWDVQFSADFIGRSMPIADLYALAPDRM